MTNIKIFVVFSFYFVKIMLKYGQNVKGGKQDMKKMFASLLALSMVLVGCGGDGGDSASSSKPEIVMLTDKGTIDDK